MKMKVLSLVACVLVVTGTLSVSIHSATVAQEVEKTAKSDKKDDGSKKTVKSGDRLPANYAKIGVSELQRKKIYEIQNKYDKDIAALQKQLGDLKAKEQAEVESVLTAEQKKALQTANEESKKKAAEKRKSADKGGEKAEKPST